MKLRLATLLPLLAAGAASAQAIAINPILSPSSDSYTFGAAACNDTVTVRWTNTLTIILTQCSQSPLKLWATAGECQETPGTADTRYEDVPSLTLNGVRQGSFSVKISELPDFKATTSADGGTLLPCSSSTPFTKTHRICGNVEYALSTGISCGTTTKLAATPLRLVFDTLPPGKPTITDYAAQDEAVRAGFTVDSDTTTVIMEVQGPTDVDFREIASTASTNGTIRGTGLQNNVPYVVRLRAKDGAGNPSEPSDSITATPIRTLGFWGYYKEAGGTDAGGCSVGTGLVPLLLAAFAFRRARKQVRRQS